MWAVCLVGVRDADVTVFVCWLLIGQFSRWVDAVILTFSLESEVSFNTVYTYHSQMAQYRAGLREVPLMLVGTQDMISEVNPRVIADTRARLLAAELKCSVYIETCATYGLNVDRLFHDGNQLNSLLHSVRRSASMLSLVSLAYSKTKTLLRWHPLALYGGLICICQFIGRLVEGWQVRLYTETDSEIVG